MVPNRLSGLNRGCYGSIETVRFQSFLSDFIRDSSSTHTLTRSHTHVHTHTHTHILTHTHTYTHIHTYAHIHTHTHTHTHTQTHTFSLSRSRKVAHTIVQRRAEILRLGAGHIRRFPFMVTRVIRVIRC
jgi:hypothetical protein